MPRQHIGQHHTTRQTGHRNRTRTGRGSYSRNRKARDADRYGSYTPLTDRQLYEIREHGARYPGM